MRSLGIKFLDKLEKMGLTDLRKHIIYEDVWTPEDIEKIIVLIVVQYMVL